VRLPNKNRVQLQPGELLDAQQHDHGEWKEDGQVVWQYHYAAVNYFQE